MHKSWKTAIARKAPSRAVQWVEQRHRLLSDDPSWTIKSTTGSKPGSNRILDYGCGRGFDAEYMGADGYDPHWQPVRPEGPYDIIFCTYVLNVMPRPEQLEVLRDIDSLLGTGGVSYVTVRRDIPLNIDKKNATDPDMGETQFYVFDGNMKSNGYMSVHYNQNDFQIYVKSGYGDY